MPYIGELVLYQSDTGRYRWATIAGNISGSTADLCVFSDGDDWENSALADNVSYMRYAKDMGTGVDEWMPNVDTKGLAPVSPSTPSRSIGSAFQPSTTQPTYVSYALRVVSSITLSGGQAGRIELRSDSSNPPSTVRGRVAGGATGTVVVGVSMSDTAEGTISYIVPAGHYVLLQSVNETGTPTYSINSQVEIPL